MLTHLRDLGREAGASIGARPGRALLTSIGISLGIASLLASTSMAESSAASIRGQLEEVAVTTVTVQLGLERDADPTGSVAVAEANLRSIEGVVEVGSSVALTDVLSPPVARPDLEGPARGVEVLAVSPTFGAAVGVAGPARSSSATAIVGRLAAEPLGISPERDATVFVGGRPFPVTAVAGRGAIDRRVDSALQIPLASAAAFGWLGGADEALVVVRTTAGQAERVATVAALAASPREPALAEVTVAPDPRHLRAGIQGDTLLLVSALTVVLLGVGLFSIANVMLARVLERTAEIGLRRALGASRRDIAILLLLESGAIGLLGGTAGAVVAASASTATAAVQGWPLALHLPWFVLAPLGGAAVGCAAGTYPALRAARLDPVAALQR